MSSGIGAYGSSTSTSTSVLAAALVELLLLHLAHVHAGDPHVSLDGERRRLGDGDLEPVALGASGTDPPKVTHRKSSTPKHDSVNAAMATMRPMLGADLFTRRTPPASGRGRRHRACPRSGRRPVGTPVCVEQRPSVPQLTPPSDARRNGPWASEVLNTEFVFCATQASQYR